jgi:hypothetical protein
LVTQAEIEAAAEAYLHVGIGESIHAGMLAVLEAAERVRPKRKDGTVTERSRRFRAKRNGVAQNGVAAAGGNAVAEGGNAVAEGGNGVTRNGVAGADSLTPLSLLLALKHAANGNIQPACTDVEPIRDLLQQGCDLDLDILPAVRDLLTDPIQPPLKRWSVPWLAAEIVRRQDERTGHVTPARARAAPVRQPAAPPCRSGPPPAAPSLDMDELVAGYRAGNVDWDATRFGPPPGSRGAGSTPRCSGRTGMDEAPRRCR